jgi:hypothetical protein
MEERKRAAGSKGVSGVVRCDCERGEGKGVKGIGM